MSGADKWPDSTTQGGFQRMHLRPVLRLGRFQRAFTGERRLADDWAFDSSHEHIHKPLWSAELLYEMITTTLEGIKALPGPDRW